MRPFNFKIKDSKGRFPVAFDDHEPLRYYILCVRLRFSSSRLALALPSARFERPSARCPTRPLARPRWLCFLDLHGTNCAFVSEVISDLLKDYRHNSRRVIALE